MKNIKLCETCNNALITTRTVENNHEIVTTFCLVTKFYTTDFVNTCTQYKKREKNNK